MKVYKKIAAVLSIALASIFVGAAPTQAAATTLTIGALQDVKSWDPGQAHIGHQIQLYQAAYDTLIRRSPDGSLKPNLATNWSWSADKKNLTMTLRSGVKFSNGELFDAAAVKANLDNNKAANGPQSPQLAQISSVAVTGRFGVRITLSSPNPALPIFLSTSSGFMAAPSLLGKPALAAAPVGSGPYILNSGKSSKGSTYVFDANPNYWNKSIQKFNTVTFKIMTDTTARLNALVSGQIDATLLDYPTTSAALAGGAKLKQNFVDWSGLLLWDRDGKIVKPLGDVRVRQALNYAFDRVAMNKALVGGQGEPTNQVLGEKSGAYDAALDKAYPYNPAKAKELLKAAGYPNGFELPMPNITFANASMAAFIAQYLKDINVTVKWIDVSPAAFVTELRSGKYAASWFQLYQGSIWEAMVQMVTPDATWNILKSTDPEITKLLDQSKAQPTKLTANATKINQLLTEKAWFVPLYRIPQQYFVGKNVTVESQIQNAVPYLYNFAPNA
jgi:peptide/nickel transport system substrate-binding protein